MFYTSHPAANRHPQFNKHYFKQSPMSLPYLYDIMSPFQTSQGPGYDNWTVQWNIILFLSGDGVTERRKWRAVTSSITWRFTGISCHRGNFSSFKISRPVSGVAQNLRHKALSDLEPQTHSSPAALGFSFRNLHMLHGILSVFSVVINLIIWGTGVIWRYTSPLLKFSSVESLHFSDKIYLKYKKKQNRNFM